MANKIKKYLVSLLVSALCILIFIALIKSETERSAAFAFVEGLETSEAISILSESDNGLKVTRLLFNSGDNTGVSKIEPNSDLGVAIEEYRMEAIAFYSSAIVRMEMESGDTDDEKNSKNELKNQFREIIDNYHAGIIRLDGVGLKGKGKHLANFEKRHQKNIYSVVMQDIFGRRYVYPKFPKKNI